MLKDFMRISWSQLRDVKATCIVWLAAFVVTFGMYVLGRMDIDLPFSIFSGWRMQIEAVHHVLRMGAIAFGMFVLVAFVRTFLLIKHRKKVLEEQEKQDKLITNPNRPKKPPV